jgi:hypothetical protein
MSSEIVKQTIYRGEDIELVLFVEDGTGRPFALTTPATTEINVKFLNEDGTCLEKKLSLAEVVIVSEAGGEYKVTIPSADTLLLQKGEDLDFAAHITKSSKLRIAPYINALDVFDPPCV